MFPIYSENLDDFVDAQQEIVLYVADP